MSPKINDFKSIKPLFDELVDPVGVAICDDDDDDDV